MSIHYYRWKTAICHYKNINSLGSIVYNLLSQQMSEVTHRVKYNIIAFIIEFTFEIFRISTKRGFRSDDVCSCGFGKVIINQIQGRGFSGVRVS